MNDYTSGKVWHAVMVGAVSLVLAMVCPFPPLVGTGTVEAARNLTSSALVESKDDTWGIEAQKLSFDQKNKTYLAEGNVRIETYSPLEYYNLRAQSPQQGGAAGRKPSQPSPKPSASSDYQKRIILADWAEMNTLTHTVDLRGNVELRFGQSYIAGDHVVWHLDTETGWIDGGTIYFADTGFYVQSMHIEKTGVGTYLLENGVMTSCELDSPAWSIAYDRLDVTTGGMGWARNMTLRAAGYPFFYFPIVGLPINKDRASGFLRPIMGHSSLNGYMYEQPFFWAFRRDMDLTIYPNYMTERGLMNTFEYRIADNTWGDGIWMFSYLRDQGDPESLADDGYLKYDDRYWFRGRHNFELPYGIEGWFNVDYVSDLTYLREFNKGGASYDFSSAAFHSFTRTGIISDQSAISRESNMYVKRSGDDMLLAMDARYWENLVGAEEDTLQQYPKLTYSIAPVPFYETFPVYYSFDSSMVNYYREEGSSGQRLDLRPRIYYPMRWRNYLNVEPSLAFRSTSYWTGNGEDSSFAGVQSEEDGFKQRFVGDFRFDANTEFSRVFPVVLGDTVAVQNVIRPEIAYRYRHVDENEDIPQFDSLDQLDDFNAIQYGLTAFLITKRHALGGAPSYNDLLRFRLFQFYNITPQFPTLQDPLLYDESFLGNDPTDYTAPGIEKEHFSNVFADVSLSLWDYLSFSSNVSVSPYDGEISRYDYGIILDSTRGQALKVGYRVREDVNIEEIKAAAGIQILPRIGFSAQYNYSLSYDTLISQEYSFSYRHGCWGLRFTVTDENENQTATLSLLLQGIGEFGGGFSPASGVSVKK